MDRTKLAKENKSDLIEFCKTNNIDTSDCFAKIDYVNLIVENGFGIKQFTQFFQSSNSTIALKPSNDAPTIIGLKSPNKPAAITRTATRFLVDANIESEDEIDMANFIMAAHYLGSAANDEQLIDIFVNMEQESDDKTAKQMVKDLMKKVEEEYGKAQDNTDGDTEVFQIETDKEDDEYIDHFLISQQQDQNLEIAKNLMASTALTRHEVAEITGVSADALKDYESDEYDSDELETDSEADDDDDIKEDKPKETQKAFDGVKIVASNKKTVIFTKHEMNTLKQMILKQMIDADDALNLLQKLSDAINIAPGSMKRAKTLAKLTLDVEVQVKLPSSYRVVIDPGALCKANKDKTSEYVGSLKIGTMVIVEEIADGRARISEPYKGWCSLVSSRNGKPILQRADLKSNEMDKAVRRAMTRQTKIMVLKSVTTLNDKTVERMLERVNWNLSVAVDSFFVAKFKTQEFVEKNAPKNDGNGEEKNKDGTGWFTSWKKFANH